MIILIVRYLILVCCTQVYGMEKPEIVMLKNNQGLMDKKEMETLFQGIKKIYDMDATTFQSLKRLIETDADKHGDYHAIFLKAGLVTKEGALKKGVKNVFLASVESVFERDSDEDGSDQVLVHNLTYPIHINEA
jgi:hypothetical protein